MSDIIGIALIAWMLYEGIQENKRLEQEQLNNN